MLQILGLFDGLNMDVKAEMQGREELKTKLEESQKREEIMDVALKAVNAKKKGWQCE